MAGEASLARINVTGQEALAAVVLRLRTALGLDDRNCYFIEKPGMLPQIPISGDYWLTVSAGDGMFVEGNQHPSQLTETTEAIVTGYTRMQLDSTDHADILLFDARRGLLEIKRKILQSLVAQDLTVDAGNPFLRELVWAVRASQPKVGNYGGGGLCIGSIEVVFRISYDWNLEDPEDNATIV